MSEANVRVIYTERKRLTELQDETDGGHIDGGLGGDGVRPVQLQAGQEHMYFIMSED